MNDNNNSNSINDQKSPKGINFGRIGSNARKRFGILGNGNGNGNGAQPKMGRLKSTAARGLQSLRFLDGATGKDGDSWKPVEKRFNQNAVQGRLHREKFSAVIGKYFGFTLLICVINLWVFVFNEIMIDLGIFLGGKQGMGDSKEFAGELFDTLARRRNVDVSNGITIDEMRMFWEEMTSQDIDARLQIFFDMLVDNLSMNNFVFVDRFS